MRVSTDKSDPGYPLFMRTQQEGVLLKVYLDGQEIDEVETADEEEGVLVRYCTGENGELLLTPSREEIERETLQGRVEVRKVYRE